MGYYGPSDAARQWVAELQEALTQYTRKAEGVRSNPYLTDDARRYEADKLRQTSVDRVTKAIDALWGHGDLVLRALDEAKAGAHAARSKADKLDQVALQNAYRRLPSMLGRFVSLHDVHKWYEDEALEVERRALQDLGADVLVERFGVDTRLGGFLARMRADRELSLLTPAVQEAEAVYNEVKGMAADAWTLSEHARAVLNFGVFDDASRVLRGIDAGYTFDDASDPNAKAEWTFERVLDVASIAVGSS